MKIIGHRASGIGHRASGIGHRASGNTDFVYPITLDSKKRVQFPFSLPHYSLFSVFKNHVTKPRFTFLCLMLLGISSANALTAQTAQQIEGNQPIFVSNLAAENKIGFTVDGRFYSEHNNNINGSEIKEFEGHYRLSDFVVSAQLADSLDRVNNYNDIDGDEADPTTPFEVNFVGYSWVDGNGNKIPNSEYNKVIGCASGYSMPLKLQITEQAKPYSQYGIPREGMPATFTKTYQIAVKPELCYVKPYAIEIFPDKQWVSFDSVNNFAGWNNTNYRNRSAVGGGYTSDYVPDMGFKVNPTESGGRRFPTTGFPGAKFQLIMSGAQRDYRYSLINNPGGRVSVDPDNGYVTLHGKPSGDVTVRATLIRNQQVNFDYTFNPTTVWAWPIKDFFGGWYSALNKCGNLDHILLHTQLTNAPLLDDVNYDFIMRNGYTRAIDGTLFSEWGYTTHHSYPDSDWSEWDTDRYWSRLGNVGRHPIYRHVDVDAATGMIGTDCESYDNSCPNFLACL